MAWKRQVLSKRFVGPGFEWKVQPKGDCPWCSGRGIVRESVPYGSTNASYEVICDCVLDVLPANFNDRKDEILVVPIEREVD